MSAFDRFVGIPYADKGRGDSVDCWGLVWRVFHEMRGITLPSYAERYVTAHDRAAMAELIAGELAPLRGSVLAANKSMRYASVVDALHRDEKLNVEES